MALASIKNVSSINPSAIWKYSANSANLNTQMKPEQPDGPGLILVEAGSVNIMRTISFLLDIWVSQNKSTLCQPEGRPPMVNKTGIHFKF